MSIYYKTLPHPEWKPFRVPNLDDYGTCPQRTLENQVCIEKVTGAPSCYA